jgi:hypothetical protein
MGFTQPLTGIVPEINEKRKMFLGSRGWLVHKADSLTAICEPIV